jgi:hypothetical protein
VNVWWSRARRRGKTVRARGAWVALPGGPSTSPLGVMKFAVIAVALCLVAAASESVTIKQISRKGHIFRFGLRNATAQPITYEHWSGPGPHPVACCRSE